MKRSTPRSVRTLSCVGAVACALVAARSGAAVPRQVNVGKTNFVDRWITNVVEVQMPRNHFVTDYRTNWVQVVRTNAVDVFATNVLNRYRTNFFIVDVPRTNYVQGYLTNWTTLHFTNWNTVIAFKTNWVYQPVTNTVQIDLPAPHTPVRAAHNATVPTSTETPPPLSFGPLTMDARRGGRSLPNNLVDVLLSVRWSSGKPAAVKVQEWRIESDTGSFLCFGQDQQFSRGLAPGKYKIQVKAHTPDNSTLVAALGTLAVSPDDVSLQPRQAGRL